MARLTRANPSPAREGGSSSGPVRLDDDERVYVADGDIVAGKYRVDRVLGVGGVAFVVAATHEELGGHFALKFLKRRFLSDKTIVERFTREARAACRLKSEYVARVYDVGSYDGAPFIVMEHLLGRDLAAVLADRGALPAGEAVEYVVEACAALAVAHAEGIVHRDIKPENLFLVDREGLPTIKLLDFGISKFALVPARRASSWSDTEDPITGALTCGTPFYMSPEQIRSTASVDARSDLWSLGVVLYELLAAAPPFDGENVTDVCQSILDRAPPPLSDLRPEIAPGLSDVVSRCLQKDPADRFASVAELAVALLPYASPRALAVAEGSASIRHAAIHMLVGGGETRVSSAFPVIPPGARSSLPTPEPRASFTAFTSAPAGRWPRVIAASALAASIATYGTYRALGGHESGATIATTATAPLAPVVVAAALPGPAPPRGPIDERAAEPPGASPAITAVAPPTPPARAFAPARARAASAPGSAAGASKAAGSAAGASRAIGSAAGASRATGSPSSTAPRSPIPSAAPPVFSPPVAPGRPDLGY